MLPQGFFLWASVCRRRCEGEGDEVCGCRSQRVTAAAGGWVVYWDGTMMSVLNSCGRPAAGGDVACQCCRDIWSHWFRTFQVNWNRVLNQVCWNSRYDEVTCRLVSLCNSRTSLLIQCISDWLFYPLTFSLTSSLSDRFFPRSLCFLSPKLFHMGGSTLPSSPVSMWFSHSHSWCPISCFIYER